VFARVQTLHEPAEKLDELAAIARQQLPSAHELAGFSGFYYLIDRANEQALVISLWETEDDLRKVEAGGAAVREHVEAEAGVRSPPAEVFEVALRAT